MLTFFMRRLGVGLSVALTVSALTFILLNVAVDPAEAIAGEDAELLVIEQIRAEYGFDRPLYEQYFSWMGRVLQGDLGESYYWNKNVGALIADKAPVTITLALLSLAVTLIIAIPLGCFAGLYPNSLIDRIALTIAVSAQAIPNFWLGLMLIFLLAVMYPIFPVSGDESLAHFILPAFVLGSSSVPAVMRLMRTGLLEVMNSDYIRTARSKGYAGIHLVIRHAMRNALLPVVSVLAVQLGHKFGGSVITESIFALNGLGRLALESILGADIPTIQMLVFLFVMIFLIMNVIADVLNAYLDPRLRSN